MDFVLLGRLVAPLRKDVSRAWSIRLSQQVREHVGTTFAIRTSWVFKLVGVHATTTTLDWDKSPRGLDPTLYVKPVTILAGYAHTDELQPQLQREMLQLEVRRLFVERLTFKEVVKMNDFEWLSQDPDDIDRLIIRLISLLIRG